MWKTILAAAALASLAGGAAFAQRAKTTRTAVLRRDPDAHAKVLAHLEDGERLMLVDASPDEGFYHVRTEEDDVGWVAVKSVTVEPAAAAARARMAHAVAPGGEACDGSLWDHVYHPARLLVRRQCISVTGTIVDATNGREPDGVRHEPDGDTHGWLKLDSGFENLLNDGNVTDEGGNLVFEVVCKFQVKQQDAERACADYHATVVLPPVGSHVKIVGAFVQDSFHAQWNEIHPVTSITVIP